ncbi:hypothetical protein P153DRAFT_364819 [Dothidotthia symphoricarpi CBS 119687]|uniref:Uncharacterized protein n=1 Tax=Dothidotthia symphoricarpi CBS 119687 TaxID=1392245 RepID=A0A6A6AMQ5_9PLEO|nr:uncharacterized protein P153DRAFT_364819 [Dothidotthia symphoricarpi CBS 119687]KAF2132418.1 hypothetical protein P153DRAFT_364819 [Dothidotthia symphoricarpi CBS 119687]
MLQRPRHPAPRTVRTIHTTAKKTSVRMSSTTSKRRAVDKKPLARGTNPPAPKSTKRPAPTSTPNPPPSPRQQQPTPATPTPGKTPHPTPSTGPPYPRTTTIPLPRNPLRAPSPTSTPTNPSTSTNKTFARPAPPHPRPAPAPGYRAPQSRRIIEPTPDIRLPDKYKPAARRVTSIIVGIPIILVVGYELYNRYRAEIRTKWDEGGRRV